jgi:hypothetical protein
VWRAVDDELSALRLESATSALHRAFDDLDRTIAARGAARDPIAAAVADLAGRGPLPGQTGVVVAAGGRCLAADLFDVPGTLAEYWRQIVTSHAFDLPSDGGEVPSIDRALRFVRRVRHARRTNARGVGLGTEHHYESDRIVANALQWDGSLVHLSVLAA